MKKIVIWEVCGAVAIIIAGTILHNVYKMNSYWLFGILSPVNESVWEHLKIAIWPVFIFGIIEFPFVRKAAKNFLTAKIAQAYAACVSVLVIFYSYTVLLGYNILIIDILTFIVAVIIGQYVSYRLLTAKEIDESIEHMATYALYIMIGAVIYATYFPPHFPMFMDTTNGTYGMPAKRSAFENTVFLSRNALLAILVVLVGFFIMNISSPFRMWSLNRKMDRIISLLEKIAKK